jgi:hypothetical protein
MTELNYKFKVGERVMLTKSAEIFYGPDKSQGAGGHGTIVAIRTPEMNPDNFGRCYMVKWDSNPIHNNSYKQDDICLAKAKVVFKLVGD